MKRQLFLVFFVFFTRFVFSQNFVNDAALWAGVSYEKKISPVFTPHIKFLGRQGENFTLLKQYYIDGGIDIKFSDRFKLTLDYVYTPARKDFSQSLTPFHQYYATFSYKEKMGQRLTFYNKTTLQKTSSFLLEYNYDKLKDVLVIRDKLMLSYKLTRRNKVYVSDEVLYPIFNTPDNYLRRNRIFIGLVHKINKNLDIDLYFLLQRYYNSPGPLASDYVYGVNFDFSF